MKNKLQGDDVVAKEIVLKEIGEFVEKYTFDTKKDFEIEDDYPQLIKAMQKGLLIITEGKPVYKLAFPIKTDEGSIALEEVTFRTRIKPSELARITQGLNVAKAQIEYTLRCFAFLTGQSKIMLDKLDKFDYKVIEQISAVFF